ncbi:hypothetical protein CHUAL_008334 [Chamberlinius hualienensis]
MHLRSTVIAALFATFVNTHLVNGFNQGCLYGWQLNRQQQKCFIDCSTNTKHEVNIYCDLILPSNIDISYNSSTSTLSMPPGALLTPINQSICYNVTLNRSQCNFTPNKELDLGPGYIRIADYISNKQNVTFCYPLSPQLLQCNYNIIANGDYQLINSTTLYVPDLHTTANLGDFFISKNGSAFVCKVNAAFVNIPRCNYLSVSTDEIVINNDGSMLVTLNNFTIKNPVYSLRTSDGKVQVCFPISTIVGNCKNIQTTVEYFYDILPNLTFHNLFFNNYLTPDYCYVSNRNVMNFCNFSTVITANYKEAYTYIGIAAFVSAGCLIVTIIIRFRFYTQSYHGLSLLCHTVSLVFVYISFAAKLMLNNKAGNYTDECYTLFSIDYYFMLSSFTWLNIVSYESWKFFSTSRRSSLSRQSSKILFRFTMYNVYAWVIPAILTGIVMGLNFVPPFKFKPKFIPYVQPGCFFINLDTFAIYYWLPQSMFTLITVIYLVLAIRAIRKAGKGTEMVNQNSNTQIFRVSIKMTILMGISWPIECCFYFLSIFNPTLIVLWICSNIVAILQGFVLVFLYCMKKETIIAVKLFCINIRNSF